MKSPESDGESSCCARVYLGPAGRFAGVLSAAAEAVEAAHHAAPWPAPSSAVLWHIRPSS